jgi:peroxiredoxin
VVGDKNSGLQQYVALYSDSTLSYTEYMQTLILSAFFMLTAQFCFSAPIKSISGQNLLTSEKIELQTEGQKGLVVVFVSARCPCSNSHVQELNKLSQEFKDFKFVAIHSNVDEPLDESKTYFKNVSFSFPVIQDQKAELANQFQAFKTPHAFILTPDGNFAYQGGVSNSHDFAKAKKIFLREALSDLKIGQKVRTPEGRTLGCVISRGEKNVF